MRSSICDPILADQPPPPQAFLGCGPACRFGEIGRDRSTYTWRFAYRASYRATEVSNHNCVPVGYGLRLCTQCVNDCHRVRKIGIEVPRDRLVALTREPSTRFRKNLLKLNVVQTVSKRCKQAKKKRRVSTRRGIFTTRCSVVNGGGLSWRASLYRLASPHQSFCLQLLQLNIDSRSGHAKLVAELLDSQRFTLQRA